MHSMDDIPFSHTCKMYGIHAGFRAIRVSLSGFLTNLQAFCGKRSKTRTLPERKKICDNKHVEKVGVKMTREGRDWDTLIKQFIKRESTESVNEFCRKHNVGVAELQTHYKQSRQDSVSAVVEVKSQKRKQPFLQLEVNGVRIKVTPDTDKQFLKDILTLIR